MADPAPEQPDGAAYAALHENVRNVSAALSSLVTIVGPLVSGIGLVAAAVQNVTAKLAANATAAQNAAKALQAAADKAALEALAADKARAVADRQAADAYARLQTEKAAGASPAQIKVFAQESTAAGDRANAAGDAAAKAHAAADEAAAEAAGGVETEMLSLGEVAGAAAGAIGAVVAGVAAFLAVTQQWVGALQPGLIEQFNRAMADVQATLGVAFTGIFDQGIDFLERLAGAIAPVIASLKPVFDALTTSITGVLLTGVQALLPLFDAMAGSLRVVAQVFELLVAVLRPALAAFGIALQAILTPLSIGFALLSAVLDPVVRIVTALSSGLSELLTGVSILFRVLIETVGGLLSGLFGGTLTETIKTITSAFHEFTKAVVLAGIRLAYLGGKDFGDRFAQGVAKSFAPQGESAARTPSITGLEQIGKDLALASVTAAGGGGPEAATNADIVASINELMKSIATGNDKVVAAIEKGQKVLSTAEKAYDALPSWNTIKALSPGAALIDAVI